MPMKRILNAFMATLLMALTLWLGYLFKGMADERAEREAASEEASHAKAFASCAGKKLTQQGLREMIIHQMRPYGIIEQDINGKKITGEPAILFDEMISLNIESGFQGPIMVLNWPRFPELMMACEGSVAYNMDKSEIWRYFFWNEIEKSPAFKTAYADVVARNDMILAPARANLKARKAAAAAENERRKAELYLPTSAAASASDATVAR